MSPKPKKATYKAQYVIDIEFTDHPLSLGAIAPFSDKQLNKIFDKIFTIRLAASDRNFDPLDGDLSEPGFRIGDDLGLRFDYVEEHFPNAVKHLYFTMLHVESWVAEQNTPNVRKMLRDPVLKILDSQESAAIRSRIKAKPPAESKTRSLVDVNEREKFITKCLHYMNEESKETGKAPTKGGLGQKLKGGSKFITHSNPYLALARELDRNAVVWNELVNHYEQKR